LRAAENPHSGANGSLKRPRGSAPPPAAQKEPRAASASLAAVAVAPSGASSAPALVSAAALTGAVAGLPPQPDSEVPCMRGEMATDAASGATVIKGRWAIRAADFADPKATSPFEYTLAPGGSAASGGGVGPAGGLYSGWFAMKMLGRSSRKVAEDGLQLRFTPRAAPATDAFDLHATGSNSFGTFVMHGSARRSSSAAAATYAVEIFRNYTAYNEVPALMPKTGPGWTVAAVALPPAGAASSSWMSAPPPRPLQRQASAPAEKEPRGGVPPKAPPKALQTPKYFANAVAGLGDGGRTRKAPNKLSEEQRAQARQHASGHASGGGSTTVGLEAAVKAKLEGLLRHLKGKPDAVYFLEPVSKREEQQSAEGCALQPLMPRRST
jgi:hypothetical protein